MHVTNGSPELIKEFYGEIPKKTMRSVVAIHNGKPVAVAGVTPIPQGYALFSDMSDEFRKHKSFKRTLIKGYRMLLSSLPDVKIYSHADPEIEGSETLLKHLGFIRGGELWLG